MKKPSFIIGKKQIILTCMTLMLGVAVYVNYSLTDNPVKEKKSISANADISSSQPETEESCTEDTNAEDAAAENYGESEFVNGESAEDYFAQARL